MAYNSDYFRLADWKLTIPADSRGGTDGVAAEVKNLQGYERAGAFFDAADGAMVFRAAVDGATTVGTSYARSELREMNGDREADWSLSQGGRMSATLKIDSVPSRADGEPGRICIGQIHGETQELVRLYWEDGSVYFVNDIAGSDGRERTFVFDNLLGDSPKIGLGEVFSYVIDASGDKLSIDIYADGELYSSFSRINSAWQTDSFYFKAGVYLGVNEKSGDGVGQASFYGLDVGHGAGEGNDGIRDLGQLSPDTPTVTPMVDLYHGDGGTDAGFVPRLADSLLGTDAANTLRGGSGNDTIFGLRGSDTLKGKGGDDVIYGGAGKDYLEGNEGKDVLIGGAGADTLKGSAGADTFVIRSTLEGGDVIVDWRMVDKLDLTGVFLPSGLTSARAAIEAGVLELRQVGSTVEVWVNAQSGAIKLASLLDVRATDVAASQIVLNSAVQYEADGFHYPDAPGTGDAVLPASIKVSSAASPVVALAAPAVNTVSYAQASAGVTASLAHPDRNAGDARGDNYTGVTNLTGSRFADRLEGDDGDNVIVGGAGADQMVGGQGADRFKFQSVTDSASTAVGRDVIRDFVHLQDVLDFSEIDANGAAAGNGSFSLDLIEGSKFDGTLGRMVYDQIDKSGTDNDRTLVLADTDGDRLVDFQIELTGLVKLSMADLIL